MKTINRIFIKNQNGNCGDSAYKFIKDVLKRRYGNGFTFALSEELESIINQLKDAGFDCQEDGYSWNITEPEDYFIGNIIIKQSEFAQNVPLKIINIIESDPKHGRIAKVKYVDYPRKKSFWIKAQTKESFLNEIKKELDPYNEGLNINDILK